MVVILYSTNERSHWIKDSISNPTLLLKSTNLNKSIMLKSVSYCSCYCSMTNRILRSQIGALLRKDGGGGGWDAQTEG